MTNMIFKENWDYAFKFLGFITIGYVIFNILYSVIINFTTFSKDIKSVNFKKYGSWAIVTGCTDGIGKVF
jgi:hypothetical protein